MKIKFLKYILPVATIAAVPAIAASCSSVYNTKLKEITYTSWKGNGASSTYSSLSTVNVSVKDAIYGSNYNNGNYIFIYGTVGSESKSAMADLLYGPVGNDGTGNVVVDMDKKLNFGSSVFFKQFFNEENGLGSKNSLLGFNVGLLMFIDFAPYNPDAATVNGLSGSESPLAKYTQQEVLDELNKGTDGSYTMDNLPDSAKAKINTYKRKDKSAIEYRRLVDYIKQIRPQAGQTDGIIAFKKDKDPKNYSISDYSSLHNQLIDYYKS